MQAEILAIQQYYPQIYHACHVEHTRRRTNEHRISDRESSVLAHIGSGTTWTGRDLARHFGVGAPTMSATLQRLERLGYIERQPRTRSRPFRVLSLSDVGCVAMAATSVLDSERLADLLACLSPAQCKRAVAGLELLARAARELHARSSKR